MSLFAIEIKPNHVFHQPSLPYNLRLTLATLSQEHLVSETERTVLMFKTQGIASALSMCALIPQNHFQQSLDLVLDAGEELEFFVKGPNTITLLGNFLPEDEEEDDDSIYSDEFFCCNDGEEHMDSDEGYVESTMQEIDDQEEEIIPTLVPDTNASEPLKASSTQKRAVEEGTPMDLDQEAPKQETPLRPSKKKSREGDAVPRPKLPEGMENTPRPKKRGAAAAAATAAPLSDDATPVPKNVREAKRKSEEAAAASAAKAKKVKREPAPPATGTAAVTVGGNKLQMVDLSEASPNAPRAKSGHFVSMRYIGRLHKNGKVFDTNAKGEPFKFRLGKKEVIQGWDQGIVGMAEGQRRKLIIPPALAYGKRGCPPDIPANATLEFEVKLLKIHGK